MGKGRHRYENLPWRTTIQRHKRYLQNRWWWFVKPRLKKRLANLISTVFNGLAWFGSKLARLLRK